MTAPSKASLLRAALAGPVPVVAVGAHDGLGARLVEEAGFAAVWASGLEISASAAVPDANILGMAPFLAAAVEMDSATRLPVIADCDTGFGNSSNVIHMVRRYESAGIAAVCIEDQRFPKLNSLLPGRQELAPVSEFVGKILAATETRRSDDFIVMARTEALIAGQGLGEALRRAEAYRRAGADLILIHSRAPDAGEVLAFLSEWGGRAPVALVPTTYPQLTVSDLHAAGASLIIHANHGLRAAVAAMTDVLARLHHDGRAADVEPALASLKRVFSLQGMDALRQDEVRYLRGAARPARVVVPAGGDLSLPEDLSAVVVEGGGRALLDLYGVPLVQRQAQAFAARGVTDVTLVGPFDGADERLAGLAVLPTAGTGLLATVWAGLVACPPPPGGLTVVAYADLLFGPQLVQRVLEAEHDLVLLLDRSQGAPGTRAGKRKDLVITDTPGGRNLHPARSATVVSVGKHIDPQQASGEFIGVLALSEVGHSVFLQACLRWAEHGPDAPFGRSARFSDATLTDALQTLVDEGVALHALTQDQGWLEIHGFDDYRAAVAELGRGGLP